MKFLDSQLFPYLHGVTMATGGSLVVTMAFVTAASLSYQEETLASNKSFAAESSEMEIECNESCAK
jgi:hypothetical protein